MRNDRIQREFSEFHQNNPHVYNELVRLARGYVARKRKAGIGHLWEVMRWSLSMKVDDEREDFKLNNNYRSRYARLIMAMEPDLAGFFDTRELRCRTEKSGQIGMRLA